MLFMPEWREGKTSFPMGFIIADAPPSQVSLCNAHSNQYPQPTYGMGQLGPRNETNIQIDSSMSIDRGNSNIDVVSPKRRGLKMLRLKKLSSAVPSILNSKYILKPEFKLCSMIPSKNPFQWTSNRFLDFYQLGNKAAIEKERARLADELNRGYFADIQEMKQHGGKIATANKIITPAMAAVKFPALEVNYSDGSSLKLPITSASDKVDVPKVSMLCLSFRANSQAILGWHCAFAGNDFSTQLERLTLTLAMIDSWTVPYVDKFSNSDKVQLFEVSFIDSWLLTRNPIKKLLLRIMRKSNPGDRNSVLQRQIVYSFGDHYYFRKELKILNLLTGYIFLLDKFGRIRWQGFGLATEEELSSLLSCTSLLLEEG